MMNSLELLNDLNNRTTQIISELSYFTSLSESELNQRRTPKSWSILECIEHLNLYGDFYIPEIKNRIENARHPDRNEFQSSWLGNYFAESMLPGESGKLNKMKTFKEMNPLGKKLDVSVLTRFLDQQHQLLKLLEMARKVDLSKTKTSISISKWIKLRLGDTLRVVIYHNQRHMLQAKAVLNALHPA